MEAECPMGHSENLSYTELGKRLQDNDFRCREEDCYKNYSYEVDKRFWNKRVLNDNRMPQMEMLEHLRR